MNKQKKRKFVEMKTETKRKKQRGMKKNET